MQSIFITGIGTGIGKTLVSAIVTEALQADYWKPVQAGFDAGTDSEWIKEAVSNPRTTIHPETYRLAMPASPHIAAREEGLVIEMDKIAGEFLRIKAQKASAAACNFGGRVQEKAPASDNAEFLVIEGAGGLLVPLNESDFVVDLAARLDAGIILVSRNYLGSINHSLMTAEICRQRNLNVLGWIFNDQYLHYEDEIVQWSGYPKIASIPFCANPDKSFVRAQAEMLRDTLLTMASRT